MKQTFPPSSSIFINRTFPLALPKTARLPLQSPPPPQAMEGKQKTANEKGRGGDWAQEQRFLREEEVNVSGRGGQARGSSN